MHEIEYFAAGSTEEPEQRIQLERKIMDMSNLKATMSTHKTAVDALTGRVNKKNYIASTDLSEQQKYILRKYADSPSKHLILEINRNH